MANNITRWQKEDFPNTLLAIDPGASYPKSKVPYAGVALFQWGELAFAELVKCPTTSAPFARCNELVRKVCERANVARHSVVRTVPKSTSPKWKAIYAKRAANSVDMGEGLTVLAVEKPLIYRKGTARPEDILALREIYGAFMGGIDAEFYAGPSPQEWKGGVDKQILHERALTVCNREEHGVLRESQKDGRGGLSEHTLDAVGLGLFTLGRTDKAGVV